jgi:hypothetical protein
MSLRLPSKARNSPSAIGLRQIFPVQTKRTLFTIAHGADRGQIQVKIEQNQVNEFGFSDPMHPHLALSCLPRVR